MQSVAININKKTASAGAAYIFILKVFLQAPELQWLHNILQSYWVLPRQACFLFHGIPGTFPLPAQNELHALLYNSPGSQPPIRYRFSVASPRDNLSRWYSMLPVQLSHIPV